MKSRNVVLGLALLAFGSVVLGCLQRGFALGEPVHDLGERGRQLADLILASDGQFRRGGRIGRNAAHRAVQALQRGQQAPHHQPHQYSRDQQ